ncbi:MAG: hypothetical protein ACWA45_03390 [Flavobacteriales bacterium]
MKTTKNIAEEIQKTLDVMDVVQEMKASPFFKEKTMHKIFDAKVEVEKVFLPWFSPKLQLVTLALVVALNVLAFSQLRSTSYENNISNFAENYGLSTSSENTILN